MTETVQSTSKVTVAMFANRNGLSIGTTVVDVEQPWTVIPMS